MIHGNFDGMTSRLVSRKYSMTVSPLTATFSAIRGTWRRTEQLRWDINLGKLLRERRTAAPSRDSGMFREA